MRTLRRAFIDRALPGVPAADRAFAAEFVFAPSSSRSSVARDEKMTMETARRAL